MRALIFILMLAGCSEPQWLVLVMTNASAPVWGERVLVEVLDEEGNLACQACRREFAVTNESFPLSFGIAPSETRPDARLRVRGRFYRSSRLGLDGFPEGAALIDNIGSLPPLRSDPILPGPTRVVLPLDGLCYGRALDLADPQHQSCPYRISPERYDSLDRGPLEELVDLDLDLNPFKPGHLYSSLKSCDREVVSAGTVCLDTAAFLIGSANSVGVDSDYPTLPEVLRQPIFPVLIDEDEMTVGAVRQLVAAGKLAADGILRRGDAGVPESCTFAGATSSANDKLPLNCISRETAKAACAALGKRLPDEGEWEQAARNGAAGTRYPWGQEAPSCAQSVLSVDASCVRSGPVAGGSTLDRSLSGVLNLGGNLSEWVDGVFVPYTDDCWNKVLYSADCVYDERIFDGPWPHRGGSWDRRGSSAAGFARFASYDGAPSPSIGFRCAMDRITCGEICDQIAECGGQFPSCLDNCLQLDDVVRANLRVCSATECADQLACAVEYGL